MAEKPVIAYLTSAYARAADTFIRGEIRQLRALGFTVHTFSIRKSEAEQIVSEDVRQEQANTDYLLAGNKLRLFWAALKMGFSRPVRFTKAKFLAQTISSPGIKARFWHVAYLIEAAYLAQQLEAKGVKHLHNHLGENSATVALLASYLSGIPFSMTVHGPDEFDHPMQIALGEKIHRSAFTVAISSFGRSQLCRWCDLAHWDKIHIVRCGVGEQFLSQPLAPPAETRRLVCIGRLSEQKGQLVLIEAAARLAKDKEDFEIVLIGDGPMRKQLQEAIARHHLEGKVGITGWMNSESVRRELLQSRALVMPSFAEGLPVVIMEALALNRPVISTSIAGIPELVKDGVNGWLIPAGSAEALAQAMRSAIDATSDQLAAMGAAGATTVGQMHDARSEAAKIALLIERTVAADRT